ncbi:MAG: hypothetical protein Q9205_005175 [Flavoplaca limonia]
MKVRQEKAGAMREKLAKGLDEREAHIIFTHGAEPEYETGKEILELINQVKGIQEGGPGVDLARPVSSLGCAWSGVLSGCG